MHHRQRSRTVCMRPIVAEVWQGGRKNKCQDGNKYDKGGNFGFFHKVPGWFIEKLTVIYDGQLLFYLSSINGSDAFIAVIQHTNGEVTAYVCDGTEISEWFNGTANGSSMDLTNVAGARLTAEVQADSVPGSFTQSDGSAFDFTANTASEPAGLYRADLAYEGTEYVGGWIVLAEGEQRGLISGGVKLITGSSLVTTTKTVNFGTNWVAPEP